MDFSKKGSSHANVAFTILVYGIVIRERNISPTIWWGTSLLNGINRLTTALIGLKGQVRGYPPQSPV